ncbi:hypothetical protein CEXT_194711 [Caerostris extrusa]|uniref:Uncharacterized protein n=1 Tax=Caerostris extrusa TaxID=172846 RepID=A0AAV4XBT8_CAEEX|nr:hypothetical protein CEXT_194711 [Caerostris extrusa]
MVAFSPPYANRSSGSSQVYHQGNGTSTPNRPPVEIVTEGDQTTPCYMTHDPDKIPSGAYTCDPNEAQCDEGWIGPISASLALIIFFSPC